MPAAIGGHVSRSVIIFTYDAVVWAAVPSLAYRLGIAWPFLYLGTVPAVPW